MIMYLKNKTAAEGELTVVSSSGGLTKKTKQKKLHPGSLFYITRF